MKRVMRTYTPEFRENAIRLVVDEGQKPKDVAPQVGMPVKTLEHWCDTFRKTGVIMGTSTVGRKHSAHSELEMEVSRLRRRNQELENELKFVKKMMAYLAKNGLA